MKKSVMKITSLILAASLAAGCASAGELTSVDAVDKSLEQLVTVAAVSDSQASNPNDTVYVITKSDGSVDKVFDNDESALPVDINISYTLDGAKISANELAGKSGHVTIRFDYTNNTKSEVSVGDNVESLYVPYAAVSGIVLDNSRFSNITVTNGRTVDDGNRTIALGIALPGLTDNLNITNDKLDLTIPEYVEIEADVNDFSLEMSLSIVTNETFSKLDSSKIDSLDDIKDSLNTLNDAIDQILDGSARLYDGLNTLYKKTGELSDGVNALYDGSEKLKNGAKELSDGATTLKGGADELASGLATLAGNNDALVGGATQVFNTLLNTASTQLAASGLNANLTIDNYGATIDALIASLDADSVYAQAYNQVTGMVEANTDAIVAAVTAAVRSNVEAAVTEAVKENVTEEVKKAVYDQMGLTDDIYAVLPEDQKAAVDYAINSNVEAQMASDGIKATIENATDAKMATDEIKATIESNVSAQKAALISDNMASEAVQSKLQAAAGGIVTLTNLKASLDSYNQFYVGLKTYTSGVATASQGAGKLSAGAAKLSNGASELYNGTVTLNEGLNTLNSKMPELTDGVKQLYEGAGQLNDGLIKFNDEGISKINDVVTNDVETLINRVKATIDLANSYSEAHSANGAKNKYIYRSEAVK